MMTLRRKDLRNYLKMRKAFIVHPARCSSALARRSGAVARLAALALVLLQPVLPAAELPPGVVDPDVAVADPMYSDPVFWWRLSSLPRNPYELEPYFYWPVGVVRGEPGDFLPAAAPGRASIDAAAIADAVAWAGARKSHALIVVHRGVVQIEQYWGPRGQPDVLTNGRALTRSVTHMLLGIAVGDGRLTLDDALSRLIPEWRDDPRGRITVRQIAQNVSGLEVAPQMPVTQVAGNKDLCLIYCGDVVRAALNYPLVQTPGTRFEMAQQNFQLVGLLAERATGVPLPELLSERIFRKIGASDAALQLDRPGGTARIMCCMRATPRDWARLGMLILQDGRWNGEQVLPAGWVATMATPSSRNPNYGLGLWLGSPYQPARTYFEGRSDSGVPQRAPFAAPDVWMMEGGGFRTIWVVPSRELMIMRLGEHVDDWDHAFLVNTAIRGILPSIESPK